MRSSAVTFAVVCAFALLPQVSLGAGPPPAPVAGVGAAAGFAKIRPSLMRVVTTDQAGHVLGTGSAFVISSDASSSVVVSANHVVEGAASISVDAGDSGQKLPATVAATLPKRDLALLRVPRGGLPAVTLNSVLAPAVEGQRIAVAGFLHDQLVVQSGTATLRYPGTVSTTSDDVEFLELTSVTLEPGLSGSPVFDPATGNVLGIVETQSQTALTGGYAVSAQAVLIDFLQQNSVVADVAPAPRGVKATPSPKPDAKLSAAGAAALAPDAGVTIVAVPFQEPGAIDEQLRYASGLLVKVLKARGYDVIAVPPMDHIYAATRAADLCRDNHAKGMFLGSFTYNQAAKNEALSILGGNLANAAVGRNTDADLHLDFVNCEKRPLWQTNVFRNGTTTGTNQSAGITATVEKTINDAVDQYIGWLKTTASAQGAGK